MRDANSSFVALSACDLACARMVAMAHGQRVDVLRLGSTWFLSPRPPRARKPSSGNMSSVRSKPKSAARFCRHTNKDAFLRSVATFANLPQLRQERQPKGESVLHSAQYWGSTSQALHQPHKVHKVTSFQKQAHGAIQPNCSYLVTWGSPAHLVTWGYPANCSYLVKWAVQPI